MVDVDDVIKELLSIADRVQKADQPGAAASIRMQVDKLKERSKLKYWSFRLGKPSAQQFVYGAVLAESAARAEDLIVAGNTKGVLASSALDVQQFPDSHDEGLVFAMEDPPKDPGSAK